MSDKQLEEYIRTIEPNFDNHIEKGTIEMSNEYYNLLEEKMARLINENQELSKQSNILQADKEQLNSLVNSCQEEIRQLKKQLEEWENHLKCSKEMLDIQGQKGNYDYDEYMLGLYNGMEYIIALFETREPNYISGKDVKFTNNKTQQKAFINFLEDNYKETQDIWYIKILQKYKSIIGDDKGELK